ncbi:glycosyltransferase family 2 protein [Saccharopolyspora sp. 6M]|uniref:glycosyltransferase family 2 protein n=1 Tax=Saccharopolyspora sp. 6M TaxID=2877237 RepID=UPI001CD5E632|nr:glycosyltransferase [Saccharopolyspora sp. 6M]MCA1227692.1 glycosyltransferase [Saccharopolyspora sp. 6M]
MAGTAPRLNTAPALAVLVCHDGDRRLPEVLAALRELTVRPRHLLAVDTGSTDGTADLLAGASDLVDGVLDLPPETGFGAAVAAATEHAVARWGDPGRWLWLLHDDSAPEPDCLRRLLDVAELDSAAAVLGPLGLDWDDPRLVVDAGLSTDASGHRQTGIGAAEVDPELAWAEADAGGDAAADPGRDGAGRDDPERSTPERAENERAENERAGAERAGAETGTEPAGTERSATEHLATERARTEEPRTEEPATERATTERSGIEPAEAGAAEEAAEATGTGTTGAQRGTGSTGTEPAAAEAGDEPAAAASTAPRAAGSTSDDRRSAPTDVRVVSEVLAVSTAGALVRRGVFERLGGFDPALPLGFDDIDFGWRTNSDGHLVLCVPSARMRHAGALRTGDRAPDATGRGLRAAERVGGVRTFLANAPLRSFLLGVPRLALLVLLRAAGFGLLWRRRDAAAELAAFTALVTGRMGLRAARAERRATTAEPSGVRGLLTSRVTRLRNGFRAAFAGLVRERVRREVVLGRTPAALGPARVTPVAAAPRSVGPAALPAGALGTRRRSVGGLRRPTGPVVVPVAAAPAEEEQRRPSPVPRDANSAPEPDRRLLLVQVDRRRVLRELVLAPPVVLAVVLTAIALVTHGLVAEHARFGAELQGGRLFAAVDLGSTWREYLASWHPVNGGTGSPAPASLLVLALLGTVLAPLGGPQAVVALLLLFGVPLAGLTAYAATRTLPMRGRHRALAAGAYALLPLATSAAGQGRLDVVVAHVLVPPLLAGIASVIGLTRLAMLAQSRHWLGTACATALGLAVLGAFAPLVLALLVVLALLGFVAVPGEARRGGHRMAGLAALVLLPIVCLLPWPVVLVRHPELLLHGLGARVTELPAGWWPLLLSADGDPATWAGGLLVLVALLAAVLAPRPAMIPGAVTAVAGWAVAFAVDRIAMTPVAGGPASTGGTGAPLVVAAAGLLWTALSAGPLPVRVPSRVLAAALTGTLLLAGVSAVLAGRGPLRLAPTGGIPALAAALAGPGGMLLVERGPAPARLVEGRAPHFGDDDLVPVPEAVRWLREVEADLLSGDPQRVRTALATAAARGTGHVAVPDAATADRLRAAAGDLVTDHGELGDGTPVLRVLLPSGPVQLLGPDLARQSRLAGTPSPQARPLGVPATLPEVAVRVSDGGVGRVLLLAAEHEPGWHAVIDGREAPLAEGWGHQVAVPVPESASEVRVGYGDSSRTALLVVQAAAILFTAIGALPSRRRSDES